MKLQYGATRGNMPFMNGGSGGVVAQAACKNSSTAGPNSSGASTHG